MNELYEKRRRPTMEITTQIGCSVNCRFCPQKSFINQYISRGGSKSFDYDKFCMAIDKLPDECDIIFGGFAECFLNEKCLEMIQYSSKKHRILLYTTLVGVKEEQLSELLSIEYKKCVIHIPDEEGYAYIPITDSYKRVLRVFLDSSSKGEAIVSHLSCQGRPSDEIRGIIDGYYVLNELEDRAGLIEGEQVHVSGAKEGCIVCRHCGTFLNKNELMPNGDVLLCCNDWGMKHVLGNLFTDDYESIISGPERNYVRKSMLIDYENDILCRRCIQSKNVDELLIDTWQTETREKNIVNH